MQRSTLVVALALLATAPASAQTVDGIPQVVDTVATTSWQFAGSAGVGAGSARLYCAVIAGVRTDCYEERETGGSAYVRGGFFVRPAIFVGLEAVGWRGDVQGVDQKALFVSAVAHWYPPRTGGLYLRAGAGAALTRAADDADEVTTDGAAWSAGVGYDIPVTRRLSLTPFTTYLRSLKSEIKLNGLTTQRWISHDLLQLGLGLSWR